MTTLGCHSCEHSRYQLGDKRLYCVEHKGPCVRRCPQFEREPGTEEAERKA